MHFRGRSKSGHADSETGGHAHSEMTGHLPEMGGHDGLKYALLGLSESLNSENRISMSSNLNKYLHEVLRKEVKDPLQSNSESKLLKDKKLNED